MSGSLAQQSDAQLVQRCQAGEQRAFAELLGRYQRILFAVVMRVVNHQQDAADLTQQALLKAWESMDTLKDPQAFKGWLLRIGVNMARNHMSRYVSRFNAQSDFSHISDSHADGERQYIEAEKRQLLLRALEKLPARQQEVVTLRIDGELSFAEIAKALGCKETNARVNFHHGLKRLAQIIAKKEV